jgi:hypothetical protein
MRNSLMRSKIITHLYTTQIETKKTLEKNCFFSVKRKSAN